MRQRPEGFLRGALVLTVTGLIVKLMGALYAPAIVRIFALYDAHGGNVGKALVGIPAATYLIIVSFSSSGFNIAISRLVAARVARGDQGSALRAFRWSLQFMLVVGLLGAVGLYMVAPWLAARHYAPAAVTGYRALAPAVFIVAIVSALRGLFSGLQEQTPTGVSQIFEQGLRIVTGIALVALLARSAITSGAAGANFAAVAGAAAAAVYLAWLYRQRTAGTETPPPLSAQSPVRLLGELVSLALPIAVIGALIPFILEADNATVLPQLKASGLMEVPALDFLGRLQNAMTVIGLPLLVSTGLYVAVVPAITAAITAGAVERARAQVATAYKLTLVVALPSTVGLYLLATPVYAILMGTTHGGEVLQALALAVPFLMLQQTSAGILQGAGHEWLTARNLLIGVAIKVGLNFWWAALPVGGDPVAAVRGAAYATAAGLAVATLLNLWDVQRKLHAGFDTTALLLRPALATLAMGVVVALAFPPASRVLRATPAALLCMGAGTLVFSAVLLRLGGLSAADLEQVPRVGRRAALLLRRLRLLKG